MKKGHRFAVVAQGGLMAMSDKPVSTTEVIPGPIVTKVGFSNLHFTFSSDTKTYIGRRKVCFFMNKLALSKNYDIHWK